MEARQIYNKYSNAKSHNEQDLKTISDQKVSIMKERFRLHKCSMEIASQMGLLHETIKELTKSTSRGKRREYNHHTSDKRQIRRQMPLSNNENLLPAPSDYDSDSSRLIVDNNDIDHDLENKLLPYITPNLIRLKRELEDATERIQIVSDELTRDPFQITTESDSSSQRPKQFSSGTQIGGISDMSNVSTIANRDSKHSLVLEEYPNIVIESRPVEKLHYRTAENARNYDISSQETISSCLDNASNSLNVLKDFASKFYLE
jgi:hypothetical protein